MTEQQLRNKLKYCNKYKLLEYAIDLDYQPKWWTESSTWQGEDTYQSFDEIAKEILKARNVFVEKDINRLRYHAHRTRPNR